jgi:hypothetical protein
MEASDNAQDRKARKRAQNRLNQRARSMEPYLR